MSKELWIAEFERRVEELEEQGLSPADAYAQAEDEEVATSLVSIRMAERYWDFADAERKRAREAQAAPDSSEPLTNAAPSGAHAAKVEREDSREDQPSPTGTK